MFKELQTFRASDLFEYRGSPVMLLWELVLHFLCLADTMLIVEWGEGETEAPRADWAQCKLEAHATHHQQQQRREHSFVVVSHHNLHVYKNSVLSEVVKRRESNELATGNVIRDLLRFPELPGQRPLSRCHHLEHKRVWILPLGRVVIG